MIRVLIVDDSVFMRTVLKDILDRDPSLEVVGTATDGKEALEKIAVLRPDVMTLDIQMPQMDGIATLEAMQSLSTVPKILMLSTFTKKDADLTRRALDLGADNFMLKPTNLAKVRDIEFELVTKIKYLVTLPTVGEKPRNESVPATKVVLVGSSAGGPPMLDLLVSALNPSLNAAVVITQHMPEGFTASLAERLGRISRLPVKESENGDILTNGRIYVSKGGYHSIISAHPIDDGSIGGRITHSRAPSVHAVRPAVDRTFTSAARVFGPQTVSILLSGMGSDGGEGMQAVKEAGGKTLVVSENDALVYGMARSALDRDSVDLVVPLRRIPREIGQLVAGMEG
jgi:two-component system chemotaxis response regulator CheB